MLKCSGPLCGFAVTALACVGAASIAMMMTNRGRGIIVNLCSCASGCMKKAGSCAEDIASEMRDCFSSFDSSETKNQNGGVGCSCGCGDEKDN